MVVTARLNIAFMDEIIPNTPYYFDHEMAITMANCHSLLVVTDDSC